MYGRLSKVITADHYIQASAYLSTMYRVKDYAYTSFVLGQIPTIRIPVRLWDRVYTNDAGDVYIPTDLTPETIADLPLIGNWKLHNNLEEMDKEDILGLHLRYERNERKQMTIYLRYTVIKPISEHMYLKLKNIKLNIPYTLSGYKDGEFYVFYPLSIYRMYTFVIRKGLPKPDFIIRNMDMRGIYDILESREPDKITIKEAKGDLREWMINIFQ